MPFTVKDQEQTFWCWAAVAAAVDEYFSPGASRKQCEVANEVLERSNCCADGESCDRRVSLQNALRTIGRLRRRLPRPLTFKEVQREIDHGYPVCARIRFAGGGGHVVVISGYSVTPDRRRLVIIEDSARDAGPPVEFGRFRNNYLLAGGRWVGTCLVRP